MEKRNINLTFNKAGSGSYTPKTTLPMSWIKQMGLSAEDRAITISFDGEEIRIRKAEDTEA